MGCKKGLIFTSITSICFTTFLVSVLLYRQELYREVPCHIVNNTDCKQSHQVEIVVVENQTAFIAINKTPCELDCCSHSVRHHTLYNCLLDKKDDVIEVVGVTATKFLWMTVSVFAIVSLAGACAVGWITYRDETFVARFNREFYAV
jgi:hypothetical protein